MSNYEPHWIPNLKPLILSEGFPVTVYERLVSVCKWGYASLERFPKHIAPKGSPVPVYLLKIHLEEHPELPFCLGINQDNPFLNHYLPLLHDCDPVTSPINAEFLFYLFLDAKNCDALVGDLEERYRLIRPKFGKRRANFWYWTQAIRSVGPIVWAATKRLLKAASGVAALAELYRRMRS